MGAILIRYVRSLTAPRVTGGASFYIWYGRPQGSTLAGDVAVVQW